MSTTTRSRTSSERARRALRLVPGVLGAALVVAGLAFIAWPLALMAAGGFLLLLDWRLD